jgi:4-hydroxy-2-oxoheptanedioate aldolase
MSRLVCSPAVTKLRDKWAAGETAFGGWCTMGSPFAAELMGESGFDYVCVDLQHGLSDFELGWQLVQALRATNATPIVRVPYNHTPWPGKALDAGAEAVVVPMVNSRAEAEAAVAACRYAPEGVRSYGPVRSGLLADSDPVAVNRYVLCLCMIETVRAVEAADEICATPGVDGIYIGPADLAVSLSGTTSAMGSKEHADAIEVVRKACGAHGIKAGIHTSGGAQSRAFAKQGFDMCTLATDATLLRNMMRAELQTARGSDPARESESKDPYR